MTLNQLPLTAACWRHLALVLRAALHQALGGTRAIINRPVLDVAQALCLCARGAYGLAFALYQGFDGQPPASYEGCGLGLLMSLGECTGENPAAIGATILV
jgi:hypothetical protein